MKGWVEEAPSFSSVSPNCSFVLMGPPSAAVCGISLGSLCCSFIHSRHSSVGSPLRFSFRLSSLIRRCGGKGKEMRVNILNGKSRKQQQQNPADKHQALISGC